MQISFNTIIHLGIITSWCIALNFQFQEVDIYMDELFHVKQAQRYCSNDFFTWDPKLTTFPGLYLYSYAFVKFLSVFSSNASVECSLYTLRLVNTIICPLFYIILKRCRLQIFPDAKDSDFVAHLLIVYPVISFYYFLYYTDTLSISTLVLTYTLSLDTPNRNTNSFKWTMKEIVIFMVSLISILMRQTNAVWILFIAGTRMLAILQQKKLFSDNTDISNILPLSWNFILVLIRNAPELLLNTISLLIPVFLFLVFVIFNGSIVVGDKEHHEPVFHIAMLLHMLFVTGLLVSPDLLFHSLKLLMTKTDTTRNKNKSSFNPIINFFFNFNAWLYLLGAFVITATLVYGVKSHPFLLADNRHFSFYIWKNILQHKYLRCLMAPLYCVVIAAVFRRLMLTRGLIWTGIYLLASALTLIPAHLLEFRYFTPGLVFLVLNIAFTSTSTGTAASDCESTKQKRNNYFGSDVSNVGLITAICLCYLTLAILSFIFLKLPFQWNDGTIARFMF